MSNTIVVNKRNEPFDVDISRSGGKWGNPFEIGPRCTREQAIAKYEVYLRRTPCLLKDLHELVGKRLGCYCNPLPCHGDMLVKLITNNEMGMNWIRPDG